MKRRYLQIILAAVLFLLALGLTLYPVVSNYYNQRHQSQIQTAYREVLEQTDTAELKRIREQAAAYNAAITPGAAEEAYMQESIVAASENYVNQLNLGGTGIMGYVVIPKIDVDLPIYHGTGSDSLDRGTGHLLGSSLPVGGEGTHTIITGHSGMASQKMFTDLEQLQEGDVFYLRVLDETLAYEVKAVHTVLPHDTTHLGIVPGQDLCTLVTCTPTGINTHRLLVQGSRVPYEETAEVQKTVSFHEEASTSHWEDQYWLGIRLGLMAMVFLMLMVNVLLYIRKTRGRAARRKGGRYVRK
ncbi:MAG: class C sortase [Faecousia sp.]